MFLSSFGQVRGRDCSLVSHQYKRCLPHNCRCCSDRPRENLYRQHEKNEALGLILIPHRSWGSKMVKKFRLTKGSAVVCLFQTSTIIHRTYLRLNLNVLNFYSCTLITSKQQIFSKDNYFFPKMGYGKRD